MVEIAVTRLAAALAVSGLLGKYQVRTVGGRPWLHIAIEPAPETTRLARRVVGLLQAEEVVEGTIVVSPNRAILAEVHKLEPRLRPSRLIHTSLGRLDEHGYDDLAVRAAPASPDRVVSAKRLGAERRVRTVNDPPALTRVIDMGVDAIITDRPDTPARLLEEGAALGRADRLILKIRSWLRFRTDPRQPDPWLRPPFSRPLRHRRQRSARQRAALAVA